MRNRTLWTLLAATCLVAAPFATGCGGGDGDGGTAPNPNPNTDLPESIAIEQAETAVEIATSLIQSVDQLSMMDDPSDFSDLGLEVGLPRAASAAPRESADYSNGTWTYNYSDAVSEGGMETSIDLSATLRLLDTQGVEQMFATEATSSMSYTVDALLGLTMTFTDEQSQQTSTIETDVDYETAVSVSGIETQTLDITATGRELIGVSAQTPDGNLAYQVDLTWEMDVLAPQGGGCPDGTATFTFGSYRLDVLYDGSSNAAWTLSSNGSPVVGGSGIEQLACGGGLAR